LPKAEALEYDETGALNLSKVREELRHARLGA